MRIRLSLLGLIGLAALTVAARPAIAQQQQDQVITCSSDDGGRHYCQADVRGGVSLGRQHSGSPCVQGSTWGYDRRGVWVDRGCRADFVIEAANGREGYGNNARRDDDDDNNRRQGRTVTCSSDDGHRHYCSADTRRGVQLTRQRSGSACTEGSTWGYDRRGIWVDRGCRADFMVR